MMQMVEIKNGDMIAMAKVVNANTYRLDQRIDTVEKNVKRVVNGHNAYVKANNKAMKWLMAGCLCTAISGLLLDRQVKKLDERIKKLEDEKIYNDYMRDEAEKDCLE